MLLQLKILSQTNLISLMKNQVKIKKRKIENIEIQFIKKKEKENNKKYKKLLIQNNNIALNMQMND